MKQSNQHAAPSRRVFLGTLLGAGSIFGAPGIVRAQSTTKLSFSSWLPDASLITQNLFKVWAENVEKVTEGRVAIEFLAKPLGPPPAHLELVQGGDTDIAYSLHGYTQDLFARAQIGQFSFLGDAYGASHAFSKVYGKLLKAREEHKEMELLGLFQHGPGVIMLKDKIIRGPEDYKGLKLRTSGGYIAALVEDLGAENVPMSPTEVRQALTDGVIDGVAFPYEAGPAFNIVDQISFISELPNGYYNATWFLGMSRKATQKISPEDLALIKKYSADTVHALAAKAFDYADYLGKQSFQDAGTIVEETSADIVEHIKNLSLRHEQSWEANLDGQGYDGKRALAFTRRITRGE